MSTFCFAIEKGRLESYYNTPLLKEIPANNIHILVSDPFANIQSSRNMVLFFAHWTQHLSLLCLSITVFVNNGNVNAFTATNTATASSTSERAKLMELLPQSGFICKDPSEVRDLCDACTALELASSTDGTTADDTTSSTEQLLDGTWRLRFTSASPYGLLANFLPNEGFVLPEPIRKVLIDDSPLLATNFEQDINSADGRIVSSFDLQPWPSASDDNPVKDAVNNVLSSLGQIGETLDALKEAKIHLELDHSFSVQRQDKKNAVIDLSLETIRRTLESANDALPSFIPRESSYNLPFNPSGSFETTYLDRTLLISRGKSGWPFSDEVLVFERIGVLPEDCLLVDEECELTYEDDGETLVMLCENDEATADYMPSD